MCSRCNLSWLTTTKLMMTFNSYKCDHMEMRVSMLGHVGYSCSILLFLEWWFFKGVGGRGRRGWHVKHASTSPSKLMIPRYSVQLTYWCQPPSFTSLFRPTTPPPFVNIALAVHVFNILCANRTNKWLEGASIPF